MVAERDDLLLAVVVGALGTLAWILSNRSASSLRGLALAIWQPSANAKILDVAPADVCNT